MTVKRFRAGDRLYHDRGHIDIWVRDLKARVAADPKPLIPPIQEFKEMVADDPALTLMIWAMFKEAALLKSQTPLGTPEVQDFDEFLRLLNGIMTTAPEYTVCPSTDPAHPDPTDPCGLIGFPINALLDWPMATNTGYEVFTNALVNQQFKKIYAYWSQFLTSPASAYVLTENSYPERKPPVLGWLHPGARQHMVNVACCENPDNQYPANRGEPTACQKLPFEHFFKCDPTAEHWGYNTWDSFFTREFNDGIRPVASPEDDNVIANACESGPLQVKRNVCESDKFWAKGQAYSLQNMMNFDPLAAQFKGGTVYQAFLSALSYHRWHSPVSGKIKKAYVVNGTYYLENRHQGFAAELPDRPDPSAPNDSQPFLSAVATRAVIFIEADNPAIGLMCVIPIGMAEVSSCEITVTEGQHVDKGEQLGMFHFGGSTHCLVFRQEVDLTFHFPGCPPGDDPSQNPSGTCNRPSLTKAWNIPVRSRLATVG